MTKIEAERDGLFITKNDLTDFYDLIEKYPYEPIKKKDYQNENSNTSNNSQVSSDLIIINNLNPKEFLSTIKKNTYIGLECKSNCDIKKSIFQIDRLFLDIVSLERESRAIGIISLSTNFNQKNKSNPSKSNKSNQLSQVKSISQNSKKLNKDESISNKSNDSIKDYKKDLNLIEKTLNVEIIILDIKNNFYGFDIEKKTELRSLINENSNLKLNEQKIFFNHIINEKYAKIQKLEYITSKLNEKIAEQSEEIFNLKQNYAEQNEKMNVFFKMVQNLELQVINLQNNPSNKN